MLLFLIVLLAALAFEYINGFHDTANAIATVVSTKVLTPRMAILLATSMNLWAPSWGRRSPRPSARARWTRTR